MAGEGAIAGAEQGAQGDEGQGGRFDMQIFGLQPAGVMEAILPELDPTGRAVHLALYWPTYGQGQSWCEVSQEAIAAACGITRKTAKAALKVLASAGLASADWISHPWVSRPGPPRPISPS